MVKNQAEEIRAYLLDKIPVHPRNIVAKASKAFSCSRMKDLLLIEGISIDDFDHLLDRFASLKTLGTVLIQQRLTTVVSLIIDRPVAWEFAWMQAQRFPVPPSIRFTTRC